MSKITCNATMALMILFGNTILHAQETTGGPLSRLIGRIRQHHTPASASVPGTFSASPRLTGATSCDCAGDPYGFTSILNRLRAAAGLHPVVYDPELSSWASRNNTVQCLRGIGHHVNPCGVQNCGWNYADASSVAEGWMNSPGHRQNMLSREITRVGIAFGPGPYWTLNAR
jgi:uncharacterized protein YkwD